MNCEYNTTIEGFELVFSLRFSIKDLVYLVSRYTRSLYSTQSFGLLITNKEKVCVN